jgi:sodium/hydrogen exchanger 10/11
VPIPYTNIILVCDNKFIYFLSPGLLQKEYPGIAISVKTRQSIRSVLNTAMDTVHNLRGGGLLDETEAKKLEKVI